MNTNNKQKHTQTLKQSKFIAYCMMPNKIQSEIFIRSDKFSNLVADILYFFGERKHYLHFFIETNVRTLNKERMPRYIYLH